MGGAILLVALGCSRQCRDEVARVRSPDGSLDAVVIETNGGATTSFGYEIDLVVAGGGVPSARRVAFLYGAGRNANAYGVSLRWTRPDALAVEYLDAKSATLETPLVSVRGRTVSVALTGGIEDRTAPPGAMLYNLSKAVGR